MTAVKLSKRERARLGIKAAASSKAGKAGGGAAVALAVLVGLAKLVNSVTSEHTVANHVTDDVLCVLQVDTSKCDEDKPAAAEPAQP